MGKRLDELDKKLIDLISERSHLYISEIKKRGDHPADVYSPEDRIKVFQLIEACNSGPMPDEIIKKVFNELISYAVSVAQPLKVAYLGPEGTFTHIALREVFGESVDSISQKTIADVFTEVETDSVAFGIVPIENSSEGAVTYTLDELLETDLKIVAEKFLRISYSLVSLCTELKDIKKLYSHPQPLAQCKIWLRKNLPNVEIHHVNSTSMAAETASWDKYAAALASEISARLYNLNILDRSVEDSKHNYTRFLVIGKKDNPPTGNDKTSIVCAVKDKPGALYNMLRPFSEMGINMTKIESRPNKKKTWEYHFFIDFQGHKNDGIIEEAMEIMKEETIFFKILGSYPAEN